ncbi:MAG: aromatic amino acid ammonia-lyase, partial [bacterium]|nr:aromatic amino acid ammonia-lyase [bacterium]
METNEDKVIVLNGSTLTQEHILKIVSDKTVTVAIHEKAIHAINESRAFLEKHAEEQIIYGVNTGFGPMASHIISRTQLLELQRNLVRSHAVGMGEPIKPEYVLASMVVRLNTVIKGYSGISLELAKRLETFINRRIIPVVPTHGAVGTSGDLVQLAHIALALIGEGEVFVGGKRQQTEKVLKTLHIPSYTLKPKEGLSLINGTAVMTGISALLSVEAEDLLRLAVMTGALSLECINGFDDSISKKINAVRPHEGQKAVAEELRHILSSSKLLQSRPVFNKNHHVTDDTREIPENVQDVYSIRCIPQILGPIRETLERAKKVIGIELNSVTDNPIVDYENKRFLHGGNFHGEAIATVIDQL